MDFNSESIMLTMGPSKIPSFRIVFLAVFLAASVVCAILMRAWGAALVIGVLVVGLAYLRHKLNRGLGQIRNQLRASEARTLSAISTSRTSQSRHEWLQEQLLERLDRRTTSLEALSTRSVAFSSQGNQESDVLFVSSNGAGIGHLTRLTAIAEQFAAPQAFFSLSRAHSILAARGHAIEYFPSYETVGGDRRIWGARFRAAFESALHKNRTRAVVFDGTFVYEELTSTCRALGIPLIWIQRGCWKTDVDKASTQRHNASAVAAAVIFPQDYAVQESYDTGGLVDYTEVAPILLTNRIDLHERDLALQELDLDSRHKHVLIQLGAGTINDIEDAEAVAIRTISDLGSDWVPVTVRSPLREATFAQTQKVKSVASFPIARNYRAFEFGVFAAGYNSVQESISLNLPSVFVPNLDTKTDDQLARAQGAARQGLALVAESVSDLEASIRTLADESKRQHVSDALAAVPDSNGAQDAANFIRSLLTNYEYPQ